MSIPPPLSFLSEQRLGASQGEVADPLLTAASQPDSEHVRLPAALLPFTVQLIAVRLNLVLCNHIQLVCERRARCPAFVLKVFVVTAEYIQQARALNLQRGRHRQSPVAPPRHNTQHRAGKHRHSDRT